MKKKQNCPLFLIKYYQIRTISLIQTHLAYIVNVKISCYMKQQSHSSESALQLSSIMGTDGVKSFCCLKGATTTCKRLRTSQTFGGISSVQSWMKLKTSNVVSSFIVCSNRTIPALVRDLLSYNSLFVGPLYEDKSLALSRDLIFFTSGCHYFCL